jgi:uncharacterized protein
MINGDTAASDGTMDCHTVYFDKPGPGNTGETLRLAGEWAGRLGVRTILVASTSGDTGLKAVNAFPGREVIVVSHSAGFSAPGVQEMLQEKRDAILEAGGKILTCPHALAGVSRAIRLKFNTIEVDEIIANALRIFGQGMKVAVEIALMAADAGLVFADAEVISIGGTNSGADTAACLRPANVSRFFDLQVRGMICKPWDLR